MQKILFAAGLGLACAAALFGGAYGAKSYSEAQARAAVEQGARLAAAQGARMKEAGGQRSLTIEKLVAEGHLERIPQAPGFIVQAGQAWEIQDAGRFATLALHPDRAAFVCEALTAEGGRHYGYLDMLTEWSAAVPEEVRFGCDIEGPGMVKLFVRI